MDGEEWKRRGGDVERTGTRGKRQQGGSERNPGGVFVKHKVVEGVIMFTPTSIIHTHTHAHQWWKVLLQHTLSLRTLLQYYISLAVYMFCLFNFNISTAPLFIRIEWNQISWSSWSLSSTYGRLFSAVNKIDNWIRIIDSDKIRMLRK